MLSNNLSSQYNKKGEKNKETPNHQKKVGNIERVTISKIENRNNEKINLKNKACNWRTIKSINL